MERERGGSVSVLALDVGGTFVKYGIFKEDGSLTEKGKFVTPMDSAEDFYRKLAGLIEERGDEITGVGMSFPGMIDTGNQLAIKAGALSFLHGQYIGRELKKHLKREIPVWFENDANCAGIAEQMDGNAKDVSDFLLVTIGTGIGGCVCLNGEILHGKRFSAGEFGMMITDYSTNGYKTLHELASTSALVSEYAEMRGISSDGVEGYQIMSELDDPKVLKVVENWAAYVAICLFNLAVTFDPERILIGGGISQNKDLIGLIEKQLDRIPSWKDFRTEIKPCKFFNDAGLYGAYWSYMRRKA
ncbi:ROK family protein [Ligilactobacillus sp.]|uniref:ROK family protein n=1 Tax=Ligilactobacillus sp. TaxID=2767921 RepID=UPI002FE3B6A5